MDARLPGPRNNLGALRKGRRRTASPRIESPPPLVLIAEDNRDQQDLYTTYFRWRGFRVQAVDDGETAVQHAIISPPDVIAMDLSMPILDGWDATRRLKAHPRTSHIPIVACTAHAFGPSVERALIAGCDAYVVKPCLPQDLFKEISRILGRRPPARRAASP
jgi:two-component system, cell cycle response regulator DivK